MRFVEVEFSTRLAHFFEVERFDKFVERKNLLFRAGVPAQKGQHVDDRFGIVAAFAIAAAEGAGLRVFPKKRKNGKAEPVAVAFAELAVAVGFKQKGQMGKGGHLVGPAEVAIQKHM